MLYLLVYTLLTQNCARALSTRTIYYSCTKSHNYLFTIMTKVSWFIIEMVFLLFFLFILPFFFLKSLFIATKYNKIWLLRDNKICIYMPTNVYTSHFNIFYARKRNVHKKSIIYYIELTECYISIKPMGTILLIRNLKQSK